MCGKVHHGMKGVLWTFQLVGQWWQNSWQLALGQLLWLCQRATINMGSCTVSLQLPLCAPCQLGELSTVLWLGLDVSYSLACKLKKPGNSREWKISRAETLRQHLLLKITVLVSPVRSVASREIVMWIAYNLLSHQNSTSFSCPRNVEDISEITNISAVEWRMFQGLVSAALLQSCLIRLSDIRQGPAPKCALGSKHLSVCSVCSSLLY